MGRFLTYKMDINTDNIKVINLDKRGFVVLNPGFSVTIETEFDANSHIGLEIDSKYKPEIFLENGRICYTLCNNEIGKQLAINVDNINVEEQQGLPCYDERENKYSQVLDFSKCCDEFNIKFEKKLIERNGLGNYELEPSNRNAYFDEFGSNIKPRDITNSPTKTRKLTL